MSSTSTSSTSDAQNNHAPTKLSQDSKLPTNRSHSDANRQQQLIEFLDAVLQTPYRIQSLAGDASFRRYHRIVLNQPTGEHAPSYMLMDAPPELEPVDSFVQVATLLGSVVNVPDIVAQNIEQGFLLLQDFGTVEFAHLLKDASRASDAPTKTVTELYQWALNALLKLQTLPIHTQTTHTQASRLPAYDDTKLQTEMDLFVQWFLPHLHVAMRDDAQHMWENIKTTICQQVGEQPQVVVHRDYHSRNLMQDQYHPDELGIIDFQDAVLGAYTYDVVSLLRDAYVNWSEEQVIQWAHYYHQGWQKQADTSNQRTHDDFMLDLNLMGVQRHLKVLGIFVRLAQRDGKMRYLSDIPKVWQDLLIEVEWLATHAPDDIAKVFGVFDTWLKKQVAPKFSHFKPI